MVQVCMEFHETMKHIKDGFVRLMRAKYLAATLPVADMSNELHTQGPK